MTAIATGATILVALLQTYFLVLEMFLWQTPRVLKTFRMSAEQAATTATMAKNQGLYNGFLAAGLIWSMIADPALAFPLKLFFLACVLIAGIYGAATANKKILYAQALPALIALTATLLSRP